MIFLLLSRYTPDQSISVFVNPTGYCFVFWFKYIPREKVLVTQSIARLLTTKYY